MAVHKRILAFCVTGLVLGLMAWSLWRSPPFEPSIRLPQGVSLAEALRVGRNELPAGWYTNIYCQGDTSLRSRLAPAGFKEAIRFWTHEVCGQTLCRVPNPPTGDYVIPRLGECFQVSGERYLLAKEFIWEVAPPPEQGSNFTSLYFIWGGTNQPRHAQDVVALLEEGILKSGIFGMRIRWPLPQMRGVPTREYLPTNQCAIVRDVKGLVKIVPLDYLKAYADAGLVTLPNRE